MSDTIEQALADTTAGNIARELRVIADRLDRIGGLVWQAGFNSLPVENAARELSRHAAQLETGGGRRI